MVRLVNLEIRHKRLFFTTRYGKFRFEIYHFVQYIFELREKNPSNRTFSALLTVHYAFILMFTYLYFVGALKAVIYCRQYKIKWSSHTLSPSNIKNDLTHFIYLYSFVCVFIFGSRSIQ